MPTGPSSTATSSGPASTGAPTADPKTNPLGYLEGLRGQIDGFILLGESVMDPNAGRDLQNSLTDMESATQLAQQHGMKGGYLHDVQKKADRLGSKINDYQTQGLIGDTTASALAGELQTFSAAIGGGNGGTGGND